MKLVLVPALFVLAACPSKKTDTMEQAVVRMGEFRDRMCACKDKACADRVQEDMTRWATEVAAKSENRPRRDQEDLMKRMTEIGTTYAECMTKLFAAAPPPPEEPTVKKGDPVSPVTPSPHLPPPLYGTLWADRLLSDARTWAQAQRTGRMLASATFAFIDRHGALDPADGEVALQFGRVDESEAKRKLGAKVKPKQKHDDCFLLSTGNGTWNEQHTECVEAAPVTLHCSVAQIWQRALDKKAPEEALATVSFAVVPTPMWTFSIDDEPRNVHIRHTFPDDCPLAVEK